MGFTPSLPSRPGFHTTIDPDPKNPDQMTRNENQMLDAVMVLPAPTATHNTI